MTLPAKGTTGVLNSNYKTMTSSIAKAVKLPILDNEGLGWLDLANYK